MIDYQLHTGPWLLTDLKDIPSNGLKVFSCFHCGGGSTMGYKLAGYEVLGGVEIDPKMMEIYKANHNPKHSFLMDVKKFHEIPDDELPSELFNLDILDGSPPCSSFSKAGAREEKWGVEKKFREGQAKQVLDDLFFDFIAITKKLMPKVVIAENVRGLIEGVAKGYVKQIYQRFNDAGYDCQLFLLNAQFMGVPQARERVFVIARRRDLELPKITLEFNEKTIAVRDSVADCKAGYTTNLRDSLAKYWDKIPYGKSVADVNGTGSSFTRFKLNPRKPSNTQIADCPAMHWKEKRHMNINESIRIQSFPEDFKCADKKMHYVCGMSVPPFMTERISNQIYKQWLGG